MPMHAERDIVLSIPSVRLSVRPSIAGIVCKRMPISSHFLTPGKNIILVFRANRRYNALLSVIIVANVTLYTQQQQTVSVI